MVEDRTVFRVSNCVLLEKKRFDRWISDLKGYIINKIIGRIFRRTRIQKLYIEDILWNWEELSQRGDISRIVVASGLNESKIRERSVFPNSWIFTNNILITINNYKFIINNNNNYSSKPLCSEDRKF